MVSTIINGENIGIILFFIGIYGVCARRNILKTIMSISIMQSGTILFFLSIANTHDNIPPIGAQIANVANVSDPVPQALMITAIVVGISVTALSLTMFVTLYHKYGTTNWNKVRVKRREMI